MAKYGFGTWICEITQVPLSFSIISPNVPSEPKETKKGKDIVYMYLIEKDEMVIQIIYSNATYNYLLEMCFLKGEDNIFMI